MDISAFRPVQTNSTVSLSVMHRSELLENISQIIASLFEVNNLHEMFKMT